MADIHGRCEERFEGVRAALPPVNEVILSPPPCDTDRMTQPLDRMMCPLAGLFGVR
jgi:hypothetical protein